MDSVRIWQFAIVANTTGIQVYMCFILVYKKRKNFGKRQLKLFDEYTRDDDLTRQYNFCHRSTVFIGKTTTTWALAFYKTVIYYAREQIINSNIID